MGAVLRHLPGGAGARLRRIGFLLKVRQCPSGNVRPKKRCTLAGTERTELAAGSCLSTPEWGLLLPEHELQNCVTRDRWKGHAHSHSAESSDQGLETWRRIRPHIAAFHRSPPRPAASESPSRSMQPNVG